MALDREALKLLLDTGEVQAKPQLVPDHHPFAVIPEGYNIESLEKLREIPARVKQNVTVYDAPSFIKYWKEYKVVSSLIFVDVLTPRLFGVINYHGSDHEPDWTDHRVLYEFRATPEWVVWYGMNRKKQLQIDFARFIEDNIEDIVTPDGATMFEMVKNFEAKRNVSFSSAVRLDNGSVSLQYDEQVQGTAKRGSIEVPEFFEIGIACYEGTERYKMKARLRYSFNSSGLNLWYELVRPEKYMQTSVKGIVDTIRAGVKDEADPDWDPIIYGSIF